MMSTSVPSPLRILAILTALALAAVGVVRGGPAPGDGLASVTAALRASQDLKNPQQVAEPVTQCDETRAVLNEGGEEEDDREEGPMGRRAEGAGGHGPFRDPVRSVGAAGIARAEPRADTHAARAPPRSA